MSISIYMKPRHSTPQGEFRSNIVFFNLSLSTWGGGGGDLIKVRGVVGE